MSMLARRRVAQMAARLGLARVPPGLLAGRTLGAARTPPFALRRWPEQEKVYGCVGDLEVRLASSRSDVRRAQRLRYQVFYEEMAAVASVANRMRRRDEDGYDAICDHLLVVDKSQMVEDWSGRRRPKVVGTYRLLTQDVAVSHQGFYTQGEYDLNPMLAAHPHVRFVEMGRSCVLSPYRNKRTLELLWHGLWTYVREHQLDVMIGCASFAGTDPWRHAHALSYLHSNAMAPPEWRARAHSGLHVPMNMLPVDSVPPKQALKAMPPLIKGYLRLGAWVGDGAVIDRQFGTTDVLVVLPVSRIDPRYFDRFGSPEEIKSRIALDA